MAAIFLRIFFKQNTCSFSCYTIFYSARFNISENTCPPRLLNALHVNLNFLHFLQEWSNPSCHIKDSLVVSNLLSFLFLFKNLWQAVSRSLPHHSDEHTFCTWWWYSSSINVYIFQTWSSPPIKQESARIPSLSLFSLKTR